MKRLTALCGTLVLTLAMAVPAAAAGPVVVYELHYDFEKPLDTTWFDCGFPVKYGGERHETYKEWSDKDGNRDRGILKVWGTEYFYAEAAPGNVVSGKRNFRGHLSNINVIEPGLVEWDVKVTGNFRRIYVPGHGNVIHKAGQILEHVVSTQPVWTVDVVDEMGRDRFDTEPLCAYLDPNA